jgi:hypothetical protein
MKTTRFSRVADGSAATSEPAFPPSGAGDASVGLAAERIAPAGARSAVGSAFLRAATPAPNAQDTKTKRPQFPIRITWPATSTTGWPSGTRVHRCIARRHRAFSSATRVLRASNPVSIVTRSTTRDARCRRSSPPFIQSENELTPTPPRAVRVVDTAGSAPRNVHKVATSSCVDVLCVAPAGIPGFPDTQESPWTSSRSGD